MPGGCFEPTPGVAGADFPAALLLLAPPPPEADAGAAEAAAEEEAAGAAALELAVGERDDLGERLEDEDDLAASAAAARPPLVPLPPLGLSAMFIILTGRRTLRLSGLIEALRCAGAESIDMREPPSSSLTAVEAAAAAAAAALLRFSRLLDSLRTDASSGRFTPLAGAAAAGAGAGAEAAAVSAFQSLSRSLALVWTEASSSLRSRLTVLPTPAVCSALTVMGSFLSKSSSWRVRS